MLTIDLEIEKSLIYIAKQEHSSPNEVIKKLLNQYLRQKQSALTPVERVISEGLLPRWRNATPAPITQSLTGLLAKSNLSELDYKQHLADKYL